MKRSESSVLASKEEDHVERVKHDPKSVLCHGSLRIPGGMRWKWRQQQSYQSDATVEQLEPSPCERSDQPGLGPSCGCCQDCIRDAGQSGFGYRWLEPLRELRTIRIINIWLQNAGYHQPGRSSFRRGYEALHGRDCTETFTEGSTTTSFERLFSITAFTPGAQDAWQATQGLSGPGQMTWRVVIGGINYAGSSTFTQTSSVTFEQAGSSQSQRGSQRAVSTGTENGVPFSFTVDSQWTCDIGPVGTGPTNCGGASGTFSGQLGLGISAFTTATLTQTGSSPLTFAVAMDGKTATLTENVGFTVRAASGQELTLSNVGLFALRASVRGEPGPGAAAASGCGSHRTRARIDDWPPFVVVLSSHRLTQCSPAG